jgi:hypothetical protein
MERRHFLMLAFGAVAGAATFAATANAAPLSRALPQQQLAPARNTGVEPAVATQDEVDHLKPEQVRWGHHWHRHHWHRHWHRRHWHRHWGWRRHHWHRHWHRHHW